MVSISSATRRDEASVERLRARKRRDGKPFAVMVANVGTAGRFATIDGLSRRLLADRERPIVIVPARAEVRLAHGVCNGLPTVGLFLPYTPLHWLVIWELLGRPSGLDWMCEVTDLALVATSANLSGEPIVIDGADARRRTGGVADAVVDHNRTIMTAHRRQRSARRGRSTCLRTARPWLHADADQACAQAS